MKKKDISQETKIHGFILEKTELISELRSTALIFRHEKTGARLIHLLNQDTNNLFAIAFRTPVFDHTGVPHILEHSVLCGSKKYPLKEPFVELLRGSLATFLNAFTYPDKTVYPVSSQVEMDFFNLVGVYCDAVFQPILTEGTLQQEGWHFAIEEPDSPIDIKGVVYNEMKGVFSDFKSHVSRRGLSTLFPDTTYGYESGGDPDAITELTYKQFETFHKLYYHPSNSLIFLYGDIPTEKTLQFLEENHLRGFEHLEIDSRIRTQSPFKTPRTVKFDAPAQKEEEGTATVFVSWMFGDATSSEDRIMGLVLEHYLLGTSSSPLKRALVDSKLGEDLSSNSGFDPEIRHTVFSAGLRKTKPEHAERLKELIVSTLESQVKEGLDKDLLEGSLRRTEFGLREISGHIGFPYSIVLMDRCFQSWLYDADPLCHLRFEETLRSLRKKTDQDPHYFEDQIRKRLIENRHHALVTVRASSEEAKRIEEQTKRQVERLTGNFDETKRREIHEQTLTLREEQKRQQTPEALACIPRLKKEDLPPRNREVPTETSEIHGSRLYLHPLFCGGISYFAIGFPIHWVPPERIPYIPLFLTLASRAGAAGLDYLEMAKRISLSTGGLYGDTVVQRNFISQEEVQAYAFFRGKCLSDRFAEMMGILRDLFLSADLENEGLFMEILNECKNGLRSSVLSQGHMFASRRAAATITASEALSERLNGIDQLHFLDTIASKVPFNETISSFHLLKESLFCTDGVIVSLTAEDPHRHVADVKELLLALPSKREEAERTIFKSLGPQSPQFWEISAAVNFVGMARPLPPTLDLGLYHLLGRLFSTGYLWNRIRVEGGAYGAFANASTSNLLFSFASYRDPNLSSTLDHFEKVLSEHAGGVSVDELERGMIGTIGAYDKPKVPGDEGFHESLALVAGLDPGIRQQMRESVLQVTPEGIAASARAILDSRPIGIAVFGSKSSLPEGIASNWSVKKV